MTRWHDLTVMTRSAMTQSVMTSDNVSVRISLASVMIGDDVSVMMDNDVSVMMDNDVSVMMDNGVSLLMNRVSMGSMIGSHVEGAPWSGRRGAWRRGIMHQ